MKPRTIDQILDEIAGQEIRHDVDLSARIMTAARKDTASRMKAKPILITLISVLAVITLIFTGPDIVKAMQRLLGYIPGVGLVEDNVPMRILEEPVQSTRNETIVTINQGVVDSERTTLLYQVEHIPSSENADFCNQLPELRLPDGSLLEGKIDSGNSWVSGYSRRVQFNALPADVNEAVLVLPCLEQTANVPEMQGWEFPLQFVPAPPETTVYPLIDLPTPTSMPTEIVSDLPAEDESVNTESISISLDQYIQTDADMLLIGTLNTSVIGQRIDYVDDSDIHLVDSQGNEIPLLFDPTISTDTAHPADGSTLRLTYRTGGMPAAGKATLIINGVWVSHEVDESFSFDLGANPEPGQIWEINHSMNIDGYPITIVDAQIDQFGSGLVFTIESSEDINGLSLNDPDHAVLGGSGGFGSAGFTYQDGIPTGMITIDVTSISLRLIGPWQTQFDLPAFQNEDQSGEEQQACLTSETWKNALSQSSSIPSEINGTVAMMAISDTDGYYRALFGELTPLSFEEIARGDYPFLSPDGNNLIFNSPEGLNIYDLKTKTIIALSNLSKRDRNAIYSPDGSLIAFTRGPDSGLNGAPGPYSVYLSNPDGSNPRPLVENSDANTALAWMPDGNRLLYSVKGPEGASLRTIDINTGQITTILDTNYVNSGAVISPDGQKIAYEDHLPGERYAIFIANIDGTETRLISDTSPIVTTHPYWSLDGNWLAVSVHDQDLSEMNASIALINVNTCEVVALPNLQGYITSWIP